MRLLALSATLIISLGLFAAACGGGDGEDSGLRPVSANSELVVGPNRFALGLIDAENSPILGSDETSVRFSFYFEDEVLVSQDAQFVWAVPDSSGFFVANVDFSQPGDWQVEAVLTQNGKETTIQRLGFPVREEAQIPNIGDPAPASENLTLGQEPNIKRLSTDQDPEPAFYELTVAEALEANKPLVVIFATPAFCQTRFCGPSLDNVKAVQPEFADQVNFIHIEPFELDEEGQLVIGEDGSTVVAAPILEWQLVTEPWVFVVDAQGIISARFEGAASPEEIREAITAATG